MHTRLVAGVIAVFAISNVVVTADQERPHFEVPAKDSAEAEELANQLTRLSRRVDPNEAKLLADFAYATVARLRQEYRPFGTPIFNNFLVYHGWRKRGYCYQWTEDLLLALDTLKLKTLELHWADTYRETWRENNCLVVTAKGQPFERGMILECWRHFGHLRWNLVPSDQDPYYENAKWAEKVARTRSVENFWTGQTSCRVPDASRENRQDFRIGRSKNKNWIAKRVAHRGARAPWKIACAAPSAV